MTVCDQCGELAVNTLTICQDCEDANAEIEEWDNDEMSTIEEHRKGLCNEHQCRHCDDEINQIQGE